MDAGTLSTISTILSLVIGILSLGVAFVTSYITLRLVRQQTRIMHEDLKEAQNTGMLQATITMFTILSSDENRAARRYVYNRLPDSPAKFDEDDVLSAERVVIGFEQVAYLARQHVIRQEFVVDYYGNALVKCWDRLELFVYKRREQEAKYARDFEVLANLAKEHRPNS